MEGYIVRYWIYSTGISCSRWIVLFLWRTKIVIVVAGGIYNIMIQREIIICTMRTCVIVICGYNFESFRKGLNQREENIWYNGEVMCRAGE